MVINPVVGWFEITQYNNNVVIPIAKLVETTWMSRYPRPIKIIYDQGLEFIGHEFRKYLIEMEYGITSKPSTLGNTTSNVILEQIHQILENLFWTYGITQTYVDKDDPRSGILAVAEFEIISTTNGLEGYSMGQLVFGCDMIIPIKHTADWELIRKQKQTQINKDNNRKNRK